MTKKEFDKLSKALNYMATSTMESKGPEYTQEIKMYQQTLIILQID